MQAADPNAVIQQQVLGPKPAPATIKEYLQDPKTLKSLLIFAIVVMLLECCGITSLLSQQGNTPTPTVVPTATHTPTATATPTQSPEQQLTELQKCFKNCNDNDLLVSLKKQLGTVQFYKSVIDRTDEIHNKCYGTYTESISPDKFFLSYFKPQACGSSLQYNAQSTTIIIGNKAYYNASLTENRWDTATVVPAGQNRMLDVVDLLQKQTTITSSYEQRGDDNVKVFTGNGTTVNQFNQVVKTQVVIKVNDSLQLLYYYSSQEKDHVENGRFYDYNVPNTVVAPM